MAPEAIGEEIRRDGGWGKGGSSKRGNAVVTALKKGQEEGAERDR